MTQTHRLQGKTALISAAGQGIGRATAEAYLAAGATLIATDLNPALLDGLDCRCEKLDVTDKAAIQALFATLPPLDILFNCAGYVHSGSILDCDDDAWRFSVDLNMTAMFWMMQAALPPMLANGGGSIINMSSVASSITGAPNRFIYGTTKAAVIGMTKAVAADYVTQGVRCNAICPGTVESPSWHMRVTEQAASSGQSEAAVRAAFVARQPMGRVGRATEVAALAVYLGSDESAYTTGTTHVIDGGWNI